MSTELAIAQFVAYLALTAGSLTVAVVSLTFAYRQHFGWKPLLLVTSHGLRGGPDHPTMHFATFTFEFWNRRKYPVVLRHIGVKFSTIEIKALPGSHNVMGDWYISVAHNTMYNHNGEALEPAAHKKLEIAAPFAKRSLNNLEDKIILRAMYYDPRRDKHEYIDKTDPEELKRVAGDGWGPSERGVDPLSPNPPHFRAFPEGVHTLHTLHTPVLTLSSLSPAE